MAATVNISINSLMSSTCNHTNILSNANMHGLLENTSRTIIHTSMLIQLC